MERTVYLRDILCQHLSDIHFRKRGFVLKSPYIQKRERAAQSLHNLTAQIEVLTVDFRLSLCADSSRPLFVKCAITRNQVVNMSNLLAGIDQGAAERERAPIAGRPLLNPYFF